MKTIKLTNIILFLILVTGNLQAQDWQTDMQKARQMATKENRNILLVFSGSDWCAPCIKLEEKIWKSNEFRQYAQEHLIMVRADFPRRKRNKLPKELAAKNKELAKKYNPNGYFPYVLLLRPDGKVLGATGYKGDYTPADYIKLFESM